MTRNREIQLIPPDLQVQVDNLIQEALTVENIPALGLSIVKNNGEIWYTRGYGFLNLESQIEANNQTIFALGSISKSFTASIVVSTLNKLFPSYGERALDTPIRQLAPNYNFTVGDRFRSESITFRDILSHRTCMAPEVLGGITNPYNGSKDFLFRQRYAPEQCGFRTNYVYNGIIHMAADIIADMSNSTVEEMLSNFLNQLGMTDTTWIKDTDDHNSMPDRSVPYYKSDGFLRRFNPELLKVVKIGIGAGGLLSSARDMARYMQFHLNRGTLDGVELVPAEGMDWLYKPSNLMFADAIYDANDIENRYASGLGLHLGLFNGFATVTHGGFLPPYDSLITMTPGLNFGIFTAASGPGKLTEFTRSRLHTRIYDIIQGTSHGETKNIQNPSKTVHIKPAMRYSSSIMVDPNDIVGKYGSGLSGDLEISLERNPSGALQPYLKYGVWGHGWLNQISNNSDLFEIVWDSEITQVFSTRNGAEFGMMMQFQNLNTTEFVQDGISLGSFTRNLTIDQLPVIPWKPDTCGPELLG